MQVHSSQAPEGGPSRVGSSTAPTLYVDAPTPPTPDAPEAAPESRRPAAPASLARRLGPSALVVAAGLLTAFSHYLWTEGWAEAGFDLTVAFFDLLKVLPFAVLAILSSGSKAMTGRGLVRTTAALALATVLAHVFAAFSDVPGAYMALIWAPLALVGVAAAAWAIDLRAQRLTAAGTPRNLRRVGAGPTSNRVLAGLLLATVAIPLLARSLGIGEGAVVETFVVLFTSIVVEALPFVLLGALVSAAIEVYVPDRLFSRAAGLPLRLQVPGAVLGGFAFPVCECGSVPVARRLILRGLHPSAGLAFMLASPILNPIVLLSTIVAYQGRGLSR